MKDFLEYLIFTMKVNPNLYFVSPLLVFCAIKSTGLKLSGLFLLFVVLFFPLMALLYIGGIYMFQGSLSDELSLIPSFLSITSSFTSCVSLLFIIASFVTRKKSK